MGSLSAKNASEKLSWLGTLKQKNCFVSFVEDPSLPKNSSKSIVPSPFTSYSMTRFKTSSSAQKKLLSKHWEEKVFVKLRIRDVYPCSQILILPIPDLGSRIQKQQQKRGVKNNLLLYIFCNHKFDKIENYFIFEMLKKNVGHFSKNYRTFYSKIVTELSKIYRFGIRDPVKTYSGSRIQGSKRHRIPDPDPQHCCIISWKSESNS